MSKRFDLRKSPVDGKWRRWEMRSAVSLGLHDPEEADLLKNDWLVPVVTGVYNTRKEVFKNGSRR
jgi:hypothetical protein